MALRRFGRAEAKTANRSGGWVADPSAGRKLDGRAAAGHAVARAMGGG